MNEQWLQQLKEKMADYKRTAPEVSWNAIDQAMAQRKPQKRWLWRIAAAAVLLLTVGTGYWTLLHDLPQEEPETASTPSLASTQTPSSTPSLASTPPSPPSAKGAITQKGTSTSTSTITITSTGTVIPTDSVGITETEETTQSTETPEPAEHPETKQKVEPSINPNRVIYPTNLRQNKMPENRLVANVYMSNVIVNRKNNLKDLASNDYFNPDSVPTRFRSNSKGRTNFRQPIRVGVSLRYMLNNRWSLESGLTYTHLISDTGYEIQRHNFIGLPINVGYQLWNNRHFGLYVTAGGTIEKMLKEKPWQFSVNTALGAEYKFSKRFSIFAEPGLGYYFPNDSDIPTIYQDHPLNFNLNFGLRINIK